MYPGDGGADKVMAADCATSVTSPPTVAGADDSPTDAARTSVVPLSSIFAARDVNSGVAITSVLLLLVTFDGGRSPGTPALTALSVICLVMIYSTPGEMSSSNASKTNKLLHEAEYEGSIVTLKFGMMIFLTTLDTGHTLFL